MEELEKGKIIGGYYGGGGPRWGVKVQDLEDWRRLPRSTKLTDEAFLIYKDMLRCDIYKYKALFKN